MDLNLYFCGRCSHAFIYPLPDHSIMSKFYSEAYGNFYQSPLQNKGITSEINDLACDFIAKTIKQKFNRPVKIADVGGYDGYVLHKLSHLADEFLLIEGSKSGADIAKRHGIPTLNKFLDQQVAQNLVGKFDVVINREVIEHIADPLSFMQSLSLLLKKDGILFIETPDLASILKNAFIRSVILQHFHHFSLKSAVKLLNLCGLHPVKFYFPNNISFIMSATKEKLSRQKINYRKIDKKETIKSNAMLFSKKLQAKNAKLNKLVQRWVKLSKKIWIWGAGSAGGELFNIYDQNIKNFCGYIDSDKHKKGLRFAGAPNLPIVLPQQAWKQGVDAILITSFSINEIVKTVRQLKWKVEVADIYDCKLKKIYGKE